jgi:hypothetical protein
MKWLPRKVGLVLLYCLVIAVPFFLENAGELPGFLSLRLRDKIQTIGEWYQRWSYGPRTQQARYTAVVTLNTHDFPVLSEACRQRALVSRLVPILVQAGAGEVVLDLAFTRTICQDNKNEHATADLEAVLEKTSTEVPIVLGQASQSVARLTDEEQKKRLLAQGLQADDLVAKPLIELPLHDRRYQISTGLICMNLDPRKVPLSWNAYVDDGRLSRLPSGDTLSYTAAWVYRSSFPDGTNELEAMKEASRHPLTSLLPTSKFIRVKASALMCKDPSNSSFQPCIGGPPVNAGRQLRGKIVVLGWEDNDRDLVETPVGIVAGVFVQANYIESLLDSRCLRVISMSLQVLLSALWFGFIELSFLIHRESVEKALAGAVLVFIVGALLFYYVAVVNFGFYLALLPPSFLAILARCWYKWSERDKSKPPAALRPGKLGHDANVTQTPAPVATV